MFKFFKKIFSKRKKKVEPKNESWFNESAQQGELPQEEPPLDSFAFSSSNMPYYTSSFDAENAH